MMKNLNVLFLILNICVVLINASLNDNINENTSSNYQTINNTMKAEIYKSNKTLLELSKSYSPSNDVLSIDNTLNYINSIYEEDNDGNQLYDDISINSDDSTTLWSSRQRPDHDSKYTSNETIIEVKSFRRILKDNLFKSAGNLRSRSTFEVIKNEVGDEDDDNLMIRRLEVSNNRNSHIWTSKTTGNSIDTLLNFDGLSYSKNSKDTSDSIGAVGIDHYIQVVNNEFVIINKNSGDYIFGPISFNILFSNLQACSEKNIKIGNPIVLFDKFANNEKGRWIFSTISQYHNNYYNCVAISNSCDPLGSYTEIQVKNLFHSLIEKPKASLFNNFLYITQVSYKNDKDRKYLGPIVFRLNLNYLETKNNNFYVSYDSLGQEFSSVLVSHNDGDKLIDGDNIMPTIIGFDLRDIDKDGNCYKITLWKIKSDEIKKNIFSTIKFSLDVEKFQISCGNYKACISQPDTLSKLTSMGDRFMFKASYREFDTYNSLLITHSINDHCHNGNVVAMRWYELRNNDCVPVIYQTGKTSNPKDHKTNRWSGSINQDKKGNIAIGYSVSSSSIYPGIRIAIKEESDSLGSLKEEAIIIDGAGSQLNKGYRYGDTDWGESSTLSIDPVDGCTFYYTQQYIDKSYTVGESKENKAWKTRIASFQIKGCLDTKCEKENKFETCKFNNKCKKGKKCNKCVTCQKSCELYGKEDEMNIYDNDINNLICIKYSDTLCDTGEDCEFCQKCKECSVPTKISECCPCSPIETIVSELEAVTELPSFEPSITPSSVPTAVPSSVPTANPSSVPTANPSSVPTTNPSSVPTTNPSSVPTANPSEAHSSTNITTFDNNEKVVDCAEDENEKENHHSSTTTQSNEINNGISNEANNSSQSNTMSPTETPNKTNIDFDDTGSIGNIPADGGELVF